MNRFPNFPQTIDPVKSETILEQFLELNNNVETINQGYNQIAPQVETNTTDIEQLKTLVSESGTRVKVNGQPVAEWSPDVLSSDVAHNAEDIEQIRLAQSSDSLAIVGLQSDNITNKQNISSLQGDVSDLNQESARSLKTPISAPTTTELVGVDSTNSQVMVEIDSTLSNTSENPLKNKVITETLLNKLGYDLLWTNPSPNTSFSPQTITLSKSLSEYDFYMIVFGEAHTTTTRWFSTGLVPVGHPTTLFNCNSSSVYNNIMSRLVSSANDTQMTFNACFTMQSDTSIPHFEEENDRDIPLYVYGIKKGV